MAQRINKRLRQTLLGVVANQLRAGDPPETAATLERLMAQGYTREKAMEQIACAVSSEIFNVLKNKAPYNQTRYVASLRALPRLPWDDDESET
jgi:hypothetical protein